MLSEFCKMPLLPLYTVVTTFDPLLTHDLRALEPQQLALQLALTNKQSSNAARPWGYECHGVILKLNFKGKKE